MNENNITGRVYAQKVELLLRIMPIVMEEGVFAVHGGTAINLFLKDLPRYSVDIDLTYIPLADRKQSSMISTFIWHLFARKQRRLSRGCT